MSLAPFIEPAGVTEPAGWSARRSLRADYQATLDLVRRGHPGRSSGESYMAAILREEAERANAEERGREYRPAVYGRSLEAPGNLLAKHLSGINP